MTPDLQPDVSLWLVALFAGLNPATIWVAAEMGRRVDQPAKLLIAAFAGAIAGFALLYVLLMFKVPFAATAARAASGIVAASFVFGIGWAVVGWRLFPLSRR
jgi:hypothetical protein